MIPIAKEYAKAFYKSKAWRAARDAYFASKDGLCERCGNAGLEVHHKRPITVANIDDPEITLGFDNLQLLCRDCHFHVHDKSQNIKRKPDHTPVRVAFDENGQPIPNGQAVILWGAPASGKTSAALERMQPGDIIIDLDRILNCFAGVDSHEDSGQSQQYLAFALAVRDHAYKLIKENKHGIATAYITAGLPTKKERVQLATDLGARLVYIDTDREDCLRRAMNDDTRADKERQRRIIDGYFERLER